MGKSDGVEGVRGGLIEVEDNDILAITYNGVSFKSRTGDLNLNSGGVRGVVWISFE